MVAGRTGCMRNAGGEDGPGWEKGLTETIESQYI